jgi:hypothetical protein
MAQTRIASVLGAGDGLRLVPLSPCRTMGLVSSQWLGTTRDASTPTRWRPLTNHSLAPFIAWVVCMHDSGASTCEARRPDRHAAETLNVLSRYPRVRAVLSVHLYRAFDTTTPCPTRNMRPCPHVLVMLGLVELRARSVAVVLVVGQLLRFPTSSHRFESAAYERSVFPVGRVRVPRAGCKPPRGSANRREGNR